MKKIRIAGPPGTGKTTKLVEIYYTHLEQYSPTDIMVISHTNTAADHIRGKISENKSIETFQIKTGKDISFSKTIKSNTRRKCYNHSQVLQKSYNRKIFFNRRL